MTAQFWKRSSVFLSIVLSAASLVLTSISTFSPEQEKAQNALKVAGVIVNSLSIMLAAATSLDWKKQGTHDKQFAAQLLKVTHVHEGDIVVITAKSLLRDGSSQS